MAYFYDVQLTRADLAIIIGSLRATHKTLVQAKQEAGIQESKTETENLYLAIYDLERRLAGAYEIAKKLEDH